MPGMSGRELVEHIRQRGLAAKILCTSGYVMPLDKPAVWACLRKPFTSVELLAKVRRVITANLGANLGVDE
jgi:CheY-like chemotaxis protein